MEEKDKRDRSWKLIPGPVIWGFCLLIVAALVTGGFWYQKQKKKIEEYHQHTLHAVLDLKISQITAWRGERLADAYVDIINNALVSRRLREWFLDMRNPRLKREIVSWMETYRKEYGNHEILILDRNGATSLALPDGYGMDTDTWKRVAAESGKMRNAHLSDFYLDKATGQIRLFLFVPIEAEVGRELLGYIVLSIDPRDYLYPLIQKWPTPSPSAETLLVRREGDQVLYLNSLRHCVDTAMKLRLPLSTPLLSSAMTITRGPGIFVAKDYRQVKVLSISRAIPDTSWFMIAKIDYHEITVFLKRSLAIFLVIAGLVIFSLGALWAVIWVRFIHRQELLRIHEEAEKQALSQRFEFLTRFANDIILYANDRMEVVDANERALRAYGYGRDEFVSLDMRKLCSDDYQDLLGGRIRQAEEQSGLLFESMHRRRDGSQFPVEISLKVVTLEGKKYFQAIIRDISERKEAERQLLHANRLYAVLSQVNQMIVRIPSRQELFQETCRIVAEQAGFRLAWIGLADPVSHRVNPVAWEGWGGDYLKQVSFSIDDVPEGRGPTGTAIREGRPVFCNDILNDDAMKVWHESVRQYGFRSSAALPIRERGTTIGALNLYSTEVGFFIEADIRMLEEVANDISFALENIEKEALRRSMEAALKHEKALAESIIENMPAGIAFLDNDFILRKCNAAYAVFISNYTPFSPEQAMGMCYFDYVPGSKPQVEPWFSRVRDSGVVDTRHGFKLVIDEKGKKRDTYWDSSIAPVTARNQRREGILLLTQDVTEREEAQRALQENESRLQLAMRVGKIGTWDFDVATGRITWVSGQESFWDIESGVFAEVPLRFDEIVHPEDRSLLEKAFSRALAEKGSYLLEFRVMLPNDRVRWVSSRGECVLDNDGKNVKNMIGIIQDFTERRQMEEDIRRLNSELEQRVSERTTELSVANQELEAFSYSVSHDLRAPLRAIDGFAKILEEDHLPKLKGEARRILDIIHANIREMGQLIDDLLAFSRMARYDIEIREIDMEAMAQEVFRELLPEKRKTDVRFKLEKIPRISADPRLIRQVWRNLLNNALKFTSKKEKASISIEAKSESNGIAYCVRDDGVGFDRQYASKLFGVFQRLHSPSEFEGTGIGLAIVHRVIARHGGRVWAEGEPGQGAAFYFFLPRQERAQKPLKTDPAEGKEVNDE